MSVHNVRADVRFSIIFRRGMVVAAINRFSLLWVSSYYVWQHTEFTKCVLHVDNNDPWCCERLKQNGSSFRLTSNRFAIIFSKSLVGLSSESKSKGSTNLHDCPSIALGEGAKFRKNFTAENREETCGGQAKLEYVVKSVICSNLEHFQKRHVGHIWCLYFSSKCFY